MPFLVSRWFLENCIHSAYVCYTWDNMTWCDILDHLWHNLYSAQISQKISHLFRGKKQKPQTHALLICYRTLGRQALFYSVERKRRKKRKIELRIKTCKHWLFPNSLFLLWYAKMFWNVRFYFKLCSTKRKKWREVFFSSAFIWGPTDSGFTQFNDFW